MPLLKKPIFWIILSSLLVGVLLLGLAFVILNEVKTQVQKSQKDNEKKEERVVAQIPKGTKGVSLSPTSFSGEEFEDFFAQANKAGKVITWAGAWNELSTGGKLIQNLTGKYNYIPISLVGTHREPVGNGLVPITPLTAENQSKFTQEVVDYVEQYKPAVFGIGNEVNRIYEQLPEDFDIFVTLFSETVDEIKKVSPETKVFVVFQYENLTGLNGGLFGGVNNPEDTNWALLDRFPKADMIAFTTYPYLIYKTPGEIPADYYSEISTHTNKPIIFTEIGWPSAFTIPGWKSGEQEQVEFVNRFFELTKDLNVQLFIWPFLFDQEISEPFASIGLFERDGNEKPAFQTWVDQISR